MSRWIWSSKKPKKGIAQTAYFCHCSASVEENGTKFFILKRLRNLSISWGEFCLDTSDHVLHLDTYIRNRGQKNEIHGRIFTLGMGGTGNMIRISDVYLSTYLNKLLIC